MILSLLAAVSGVAATITGELVTAIPVVGAAIAEGTTAIGLATGAAAADLGASAVGATIIGEVTTTACNAAVLDVAGEVSD